MFSWLFIAALALAAFAVIAISIRAHSAASGSDGYPLVLKIARLLAIAYAGVASIGTIVVIIITIVGETVAITLPVSEFWPGTYPWITLDPAPAATVVSGGFTTAAVSVTGLGLDARLLIAGGHALEGFTLVLIATVIALLCHRLLHGSPFRPLLARSTMLTAAVVAAGGIGWQICYGIGGLIASSQILTLSGWNSKVPTIEISDYLGSVFDSPTTGLPEASMGLSIDFWPLLLGLALAAVAIAFRQGERLQRDTEGLV